MTENSLPRLNESNGFWPETNQRLREATERMARRSLLREQRDRLAAEHLRIEAESQAVAGGVEVVGAALRITQQRLAGFVEACVGRLLVHVFGPGYGFRLESGIERDRPALRPVVVKDGVEFDPRLEVGGGVLDVVSFGARLALWAISPGRTEPVFLLDEPGRFLDASRVIRFADALAEIARELKLQLILVTHEPAIAERADRAWRVLLVKGVSHVESVG